MFKIANRHPDFAVARGYRIDDRLEADFTEQHSQHVPRTLPVPDASAQCRQDEASAYLVRELEQ